MGFLIDFLSAKKYRKTLKPLGPVPTSEQIIQRVYDMAWPSTVESVLIAFISAADTIMVGTLGATAIAAVGIAGQPRMILLAVIFAINTGVTIIVSRRKGQNRPKEANLLLRNAIIVVTITAFVLNLLGFVFAEEMLRFAGATNDYIGMSVDYFKIICIGNFFYSISLVMTAAQRGAGNTLISMKTNIIANLVNIVFNYLLINGIWFFPRLEVVGAGIATALGNFVALVIATHSLLNDDQFISLNFKESWALDIETIKPLWQVSWPTMIEQVFMRIGFFTFSKLVAGLGTIEFATHQILMSVMQITFQVGNGMQIASTSLVGQSLGAKRKDLALVYGKSSQHFGRLLAVIVGLILIVFRVQIIDLYTEDPLIIEKGSILLILLAVIIFFQVSQVITIGSLRGAGDVRFAAVLTMVSIMLLRPSLTYFLAYTLGFGLNGAWVATLVDQMIRFGVSQYRYQSKDWLEHAI